MALWAFVRSCRAASFFHDDGNAGGSHASVHDDRACGLRGFGGAFDAGHPYGKAVCRSVYQPGMRHAGRAHRGGSCERIYFFGGKLFCQGVGDGVFCDGAPGNRIAAGADPRADGGADAGGTDSGQIWKKNR